jgi:hypothetical protein
MAATNVQPPRRALIGLALVSALAFAWADAPSEAAAHRSLVILAEYVLAGYKVKRDGTLRGAIERFGAARLERLSSGSVCRATWPRLGLVITFYNLAGRDACAPQYGRFGRAIVTGRLWRTSLGVEIGDPESLVRRRYPKARFVRSSFYGDGYWLVVRPVPYAANQPAPGLIARVRDGRVSAFVVRYQAGGE